jgi:hypothetical protein
VRAAVEADLAMIEAFNNLIKPLKWQIEKIVCQHDPNSLYLLRTIPGVGQILALVIFLYEINQSLPISTPGFLNNALKTTFQVVSILNGYVEDSFKKVQFQTFFFL